MKSTTKLCLVALSTCALFACSNATTESNTKHIQQNTQNDSIIISNTKQTENQVKVFQNPNSGDWGYDIHFEGKHIIRQEEIPGLSTNRGFATKKDAQEVGELVMDKLKKGKFPPTVLENELDSLAINTNHLN